MTIYERFNETERAAYFEGRNDALRFDARHGDIRQTLFKAETDSHKVYVGYDDVDLGVYIEITFKRRFDKSDKHYKKVIVGRGRFATAMERALDFLRRNPHHKPYCSVDY